MHNPGNALFCNPASRFFTLRPPCVEVGLGDVATVRILLQNVETLGFVCEGDGWTENIEEAMDFGGVVAAMDYGFVRGFAIFRVVIQFDDSPSDLPLPIVDLAA